MSDQNIRPIRLIDEPEGDSIFTSRGRPPERRQGIGWMPLVVRVLTVAWGGAIVAALIDEFGEIPHLPFITAMGMTGLLVAVTFIITRDGLLDPAPAPRRLDEDEVHLNDLLTNLPTFKYFSRRLHDEFNRARRGGRQMAVVLIDVNNLSAVNKEYGVRAGDEVLRHVARAIDGTKRLHDVLARLGDDEFGILLIEAGEDGVRAFIDRLEERLARESAVADVSGRSISLWAGICSGNALSDPATTRADMVLEAAMASLNQAKQERERRRRMWLSA